jgi:hypothetical protein
MDDRGAAADGAGTGAGTFRISRSPVRVVALERAADEPPDMDFWPDEPTAILTVLTGTTGVVADGS